MPKRKRKAPAAKKKPARAGPTRLRRGAVSRSPRKPAPKRVARKAHAAKRVKRVDWTRKPAPKRGSKARAAYEKSAAYRKRKRAADKARETRRKNAEREQRRLAREERIAVAKERLGPLLARVVSAFKRRRFFADTKQWPHGSTRTSFIQVEDSRGTRRN